MPASPRRRSLTTAFLVGVGIAAGVSMTFVLPADAAKNASGPSIPAANAWLYRFRAAIPQHTYNSITVSPRYSQNNPSVLFVIRTVTVNGTVDDFAFHIPSGESFTINFPDRWTPNGDSLLYVAEDISFAAWGVTPHGLIRFETAERDPNESLDERDRARDLDRFRRERNRTDP